MDQDKGWGDTLFLSHPACMPPKVISPLLTWSCPGSHHSAFVLEQHSRALGIPELAVVASRKVVQAT